MNENTIKETEWFYEKAGKRKGPVSQKDLQDLITVKQITYGDLLWNNTFDTWKKVEETEFADLLKSIAPPPLSGDKIPNVFVWLVAFAPLIGAFLEGAIGYVLWGDDGFYKVMEGDLWYITLILNICLSYADERKLVASGVDTQKFRSFTWLVPVYLYQRAELLHQSKAYFIVWIVCFLLLLI